MRQRQVEVDHQEIDHGLVVAAVPLLLLAVLHILLLSREVQAEEKDGVGGVDQPEEGEDGSGVVEGIFMTRKNCRIS